jgi:hypothetical protein
VLATNVVNKVTSERLRYFMSILFAHFNTFLNLSIF